MLLPEFTSMPVQGRAGVLHTRRAGQGPALLLLHGHPQSHVMWHQVAPALAQHFTVVLMDLRGYGDSARPQDDASHAVYSKRAMVQDALDVMRHHGFTRFGVLAHDRGARVAHRLALDCPDAVQRMLLLDIAPTLAMYENTSEAFARAYWHWFFLIQPADFPERMILADTDAYWLRKSTTGSKTTEVFDPAALAEYLRCFRDPRCVHASCEDYRAGASIDIRHDDEDGLRKLPMPLHVLWGKRGAIDKCFDALALWRQRAEHVTGFALPGAHYLAEELPDEIAAALKTFFQEG